MKNAVCTHVHVHVYTYIHMHIHTHTRTYTCVNNIQRLVAFFQGTIENLPRPLALALSAVQIGEGNWMMPVRTN
jgi:hypothetical protein